MISSLALCLLSLLTLVSVTGTQNSQPYNPTELILLNCGESSELPSDYGDRIRWEGDAKSKFLATESDNESSSSTASKQRSVAQVPYMTARITHSKLTYTFPVSPGPKFIRLYFYPDTYSTLDTATSFFSVNANGYTLLSNFSAYLTVSAITTQPTTYLVKEFIVPVRHTQELSLTFVASPSSFAFINGIEIVSMPENLYTRAAGLVGSKGNSFDFDGTTTSLETLYRLNVGGGLVANKDDTGMFRKWVDDADYIFGAAYGYVHRGFAEIKYTNDTPAYIAPAVVYQNKRTMGPDSQVNLNYNLTWSFSVDSGFRYLLRFHFCETEKFITGEGERPFIIFINNMTADLADVYHWSGGLDIPVYRDYVVVTVPSGGPKQDLMVALHPETDMDSLYKDAVLNGLEIFKLNDSDGSLAGLNPERLAPLPQPEPEPSLHGRSKGRRLMPVVIVIVGVVVGVALALSLCLVVSKRRKNMKDLVKDEAKSSSFPLTGFSSSTSTTNRSSLPTNLCHRFTIAEMKSATRNFDVMNVIGSGGFGTVYKGYIESTPVAVKRLDSTSNQGIDEFCAEIEMLSKLRHLHLVSLIGYCDDQGEMILVYEYMEHGTLRYHLYNTKNTPLSWKQRLEMCIGAAKGLHYLHSGAKHTIIHRDVKSSNILLDGNWVAKVSDFGLSRIGPTGASQTHVSTIVKGSMGYLDPEYYRRQQLTNKSDVYSFGVVLFEVLSARPPLAASLPNEQVSLAEWAKKCYLRGTLDQIIDPYLKNEIAPVSLDKFAEIAHRCLHNQGIERPKMEDVVWGLEFALQLQKTAEENTEGMENERPWGEGEVTFTDDDPFNGSRESGSHSRSTISSQDRTRSENVFSEILNREGR